MSSRALMTIDGRGVDSSERFGVVNPATEQVWTEAPECTADQLDAAFAAAESALANWRSDQDRRLALNRMCDAVTKGRAELARLLTTEQGKSLADSEAEVDSVVLWLRYYANVETPDMTVLHEDEFSRVIETRAPLGVVAAITPWNFPLCLAAWKIGPALRAGNTMVLKPSPFTPMSTLRMGEMVQSCLPAGVLSVVTGGDELGRMMTAHPTPRKISFTGSVAAGKSVARSAADDLKRVTLELGGNDPAIVLDDVDPEDIASKIFWSAFYNNGQVCGCIKRVYVPETRYAELRDSLTALAASVKVGDGLAEGTVLGPVSNRPQYERVLGLLASATADGAVASGGADPGHERGYFIPPTVLSDVSPDAAVVTEEQFGPVLPLVPYTDVDDVIQQVNAGKFGLTSSVWSRDGERARSVSRQLDVGLTYINYHGVLTPEVPFGGAKWSGVGVEGGLHGLNEFTQLHVLSESQS